MLIDAGGGTVDAITYTVDKSYPLRLKSEGVEAGGKFSTPSRSLHNVLNGQVIFVDQVISMKSFGSIYVLGLRARTTLKSTGAQLKALLTPRRSLSKTK